MNPTKTIVAFALVAGLGLGGCASSSSSSSSKVGAQTCRDWTALSTSRQTDLAGNLFAAAQDVPGVHIANETAGGLAAGLNNVCSGSPSSDLRHEAALIIVGGASK